MNNYWEKVWSDPDLQEYQIYILKYMHSEWSFIKLFHRDGIKLVCDAACGFGAMSALLASNGFQIAGFDVAQSAVDLTKKLLHQYEFNTDEYIKSEITSIRYPSERFDGVVAHSVIDHLNYSDANIAIMELLRILRPGGLLYLSFDPLEEKDLMMEYDILEDGSFVYKGPDREGLLFRYYEESDIDQLLGNRTVVYRGVNHRGEREIILRK